MGLTFYGGLTHCFSCRGARYREPTLALFSGICDFNAGLVNTSSALISKLERAKRDGYAAADKITAATANDESEGIT